MTRAPDGGSRERRRTDLAATVRPAFWLLVGLVLSACYLFGAALVPLPFSNNLPEPLYPPAAIVLAVLLLTPARRWWIYLLEAYVFQVALFLWMGYRLWPTLIGYGANVVEALVAALLVRHLMPVPPRFDTLRQVILYAASVSVATAIGATLGAASLLPTGRPYWATWQSWFLGDVLAMLLLAPTILLWIRAPQSRSRWKTYEAIVLCCVLLVTSVLVFEVEALDPHMAPALFFLPVPLLVWAAVRFGPRGIASALCLVTVFAIPGVAGSLGPFVAPSSTANLLTLQLYLITVGIPLFCLAALVQERERAQVQLEQSEARYRTVVHNLPGAAVLLFGSDLRHRFADGPGLVRLGLDRESAEGKTVAEAFPADVAAALGPRYREALAGGDGAFDLVHAGRSYEGHALPISDAEIAGMVVLREVTEERRAQELAVLENARTAFFNNVSHDLRTPLTLVLAPLQEVLSGPPERLDPAVREALALAHRNAERLLTLVNALLDLARLGAGQVRATYVPTDLGSYTAELASTFRAAVEQAGLRFVVHSPPLPEPAYVDPALWEQIVFTLLSNAVASTVEGEIVVTLGVAGDRVELAVRDTGVGIPAEELPHVFEPFRRGRGGPARTDAGSGVGLALVERLVKLHGGTVSAASASVMGSTFTVAIPRGSAHLPADWMGSPTDPAPAPATDVSAEEHEPWPSAAPDPTAGPVEAGSPASVAGPATVGDPVAGTPGRAARLLVVDRSPDLRAYIARLLARRGAVRTAGNGQKALEVARAWQPDLILMDLLMPGPEGFELLEAVRADPRLRSVSVILLSAWVDDEIRTRGLRGGADDILAKPFKISDLLARVDGQLWLARMRSATWAAAERERLALDLHDSVTQSVYGLTLLSEAVRRSASRGDHDQVEACLGQLSETAQRILREMRLLVSQLRPHALADLGLVKALEQRLDTVERRAGLTARLVVAGEIALPRPAEEELYFIAQEALNNALKHAAATVVVVRISGGPGATELVIADNGRGFDVNTATGGLGLVGMRERAARIGASVEIGPRRRGGTEVVVKLASDSDEREPAALVADGAGHTLRDEPP